MRRWLRRLRRLRLRLQNVVLKGTAAGTVQTRDVVPPHLGSVVYLGRAAARKSVSRRARVHVRPSGVYQDGPPHATKILLIESLGVVEGTGAHCHLFVAALVPREHPCKALWMVQSSRRKIPCRPLPVFQRVEVGETGQHPFPDRGTSKGQRSTKLSAHRAVVRISFKLRRDAVRRTAPHRHQWNMPRNRGHPGNAGRPAEQETPRNAGEPKQLLMNSTSPTKPCGALWGLARPCGAL